MLQIKSPLQLSFFGEGGVKKVHVFLSKNRAESCLKLRRQDEDF